MDKRKIYSAVIFMIAMTLLASCFILTGASKGYSGKSISSIVKNGFFNNSFSRIIGREANIKLSERSVADADTDDGEEENVAGEAAVQSSKSAVVIEQSTRRVLYSEDMNVKCYPASTTKVLTALIALNSLELDRVVTVPKEAEGVEGSSIYLRKGDKISVRDLLYGLMLRSGNDAATALAIESAGSVENFALLMNETAVSLGAFNSNFVNPHGLHDDNHFTTAYDLALITAAAYENPEFVKIASTLQVKIMINDEAHYIANKNKLLKLYDGANGVKTGYTKKSGRCLVGGAQRDGMQLISVVLNYGDMWNDTIRMLNYGFENFEMKPYDKSLLDDKTGKQPIEFVRPENELQDLAEERFPLRKDGSEYLIVKTEKKQD